MINQRPNNVKKANGKARYNQGLYIPQHPEKVIKLNNQGGLYYRSNWERKIYQYLDLSNGENGINIRVWGAEVIVIPYDRVEIKDNTPVTSSHKYHVDIYFEQILSDGTIKKVVAEIKPKAECQPPIFPKVTSAKKLESFEYSMKQWNTNIYKWERAVEWCKSRGFHFIIITEDVLKGLK